MIYLVQDCYKDKDGYHDILKIGYSGKSFGESRKSQYDTHNFGYTLISEREGSKELEGYLHRRLKDYRISLEWFKYDPEVIKIFNEVSEDDISGFTSQDELNEYIRDYILSNLIPSISKLSDLYLKDLLEELREESKKYPDLSYSEETLKKEILSVFKFVSSREKEYFQNLDFGDENIKNLLSECSLNLSRVPRRDLMYSFKNDITVFYRTTRENNLKDKSEFLRLQEERKKETKDLLDVYQSVTDSQKLALIKTFRDSIDKRNYSDNFVSISSKTGQPVYNTFIEIANERAWEVSQEDYQDKINVTRALERITPDISEYLDEYEKIAQDFLDTKFYKTGIFKEKMKLYCEFIDSYSGCKEIQDILYFKIKDPRFRKFYNFYGSSRCRSLGYEEKPLQEGMVDISKESEVERSIYNKFKPGESYTLKDIKESLGIIYRDLGVTTISPKATDLGKYFKLIRIRFRDSQTKKRIEGYRLEAL